MNQKSRKDERQRQYKQILKFCITCLCIAGRLVLVAIRISLSTLEVMGSVPGIVKSEIGCHRSHLSSEFEAVLAARYATKMAPNWLHALAQHCGYNENLILI